MRQAIESKLTDLRRQRGEAALAGRAFDSSAIRAAEDELAGLDDSEAEQARRARDAAAAEVQQERDRLRKEIEADNKAILEEVAAMEAGSRQLAIARDRAARLVSARQAKISRLNGTLGVPTPVGHFEFQRRMAGRHAAVQGSSDRVYAHHFSEWRGGSVFQPGDSWTDAEADLHLKHLSPILKKEKTNGSSSKG